jgi:chromosome segregation ATPase
MAPPDGEHEQRFARIEERIVDVGRRITEVDRRVTELKEETNKRFDRVEGDLKDLKKSVESIQTTLARVGFGVAVTFASVLITKGV